jgi:hypothetical protein
MRARAARRGSDCGTVAPAGITPRRRPTCRCRGEMKFVLFDLDDTLTDRQASLERYVAALIADFAEELGPGRSGARARGHHRGG